MTTDLDISQAIRNSNCTVCGKAFEVPRAGKLYCSAACKQFAYYHRAEIKALNGAKNGVTELPETLELTAYLEYQNVQKKSSRYHYLIKESKLSYSKLKPELVIELAKLERVIPNYLKKSKLPELTIEEWAYLKILYPNLKFVAFLNLITNLDKYFFSSIKYFPDEILNHKGNPISILFQNHLKKIGEGKIKFK